MSKYKVGDRVKVRNDLIVNTTYGSDTFEEEMIPYKGQIVTINIVVWNGKYTTLEGGEWFFTDEMLEPYLPQQIFTTRKDNKVISIIKENSKEIARGEAKCHIEDEFNFEYGAQLSIKRAFDNIKKDDELKVGDKVKVINNREIYDTYVGWFKESNNTDLAPYYCYGARKCSEDIFEIKAIKKHSCCNDIIYAICIAGNIHNGIYLIGEEGIEKVKK